MTTADTLDCIDCHRPVPVAQHSFRCTDCRQRPRRQHPSNHIPTINEAVTAVVAAHAAGDVDIAWRALRLIAQRHPVSVVQALRHREAQ